MIKYLEIMLDAQKEECEETGLLKLKAGMIPEERRGTLKS